MPSRRALILILATLAAGSGAALAAEPATQEIALECTTKPTNPVTGERASCDAGPTILRASPNHVFVKETISVEVLSEAGSEHTYNLAWGDMVDVLPHIPQPTSLAVTVHARSPKCRCQERGWMKIRVIIQEVAYKS